MAASCTVVILIGQSYDTISNVQFNTLTMRGARGTMPD